MSLLRSFVRALKGTGAKPIRRSTPRCVRLSFDVLEDRVLLAWTPIGPAPLLNSEYNAEGGAEANLTEAVTGRVNALAFGKDNSGADALQPPWNRSAAGRRPSCGRSSPWRRCRCRFGHRQCCTYGHPARSSASVP
jgi:hypothetical protein